MTTTELVATVLVVSSSEVPSMLDRWGARLAEARTAANLTQQDLATRLGVTPITVQRWEALRRRPSEEDQVRLAEALGITVTSLFPRNEGEATVIGDLEAIGRGCS